MLSIRLQNYIYSNSHDPVEFLSMQKIISLFDNRMFLSIGWQSDCWRLNYSQAVVSTETLPMLFICSLINTTCLTFVIKILITPNRIFHVLLWSWTLIFGCSGWFVAFSALTAISICVQPQQSLYLKSLGFSYMARFLPFNSVKGHILALIATLFLLPTTKTIMLIYAEDQFMNGYL